MILDTLLSVRRRTHAPQVVADVIGPSAQPGGGLLHKAVGILDISTVFHTHIHTYTHSLSLSFFLSRSLFFQGGFQFLEPAPKITIRAYTMDIFLGRRLPLEQLTFPASATSSQGSQSFASIEAATSSLATADGGASIPSMPQESDPAWLSRVCWFWERTLLPFLIHFVPFSSGFLVF